MVVAVEKCVWVVEEENRCPRRWESGNEAWRAWRGCGCGCGRGKEDGRARTVICRKSRNATLWSIIRPWGLVWHCLVNMPVVLHWLALAVGFVPVIVEHAFQLTSRCREARHMHWVLG